MKKSYFWILLFLFFSYLNFSCSAYDAVSNAQRLNFKLGSVENFSVSGVNITNIKNISHISTLNLAKITSDFASGRLPVSFTLNLLAKNPNDGTGGTTKTTALIKSLSWRLMIDNTETINGYINQTIEIPGVGQATTIPVLISLDLLNFIKGEGLNNLINLALALGGESGSSARLTLKIKPTVDTFLGPITYPGEISVIDKEFRNN